MRVLRILPLKTTWNARDWSVIAEVLQVLQVLQSLVERDVPTVARTGRRSLVGGGARAATGPARRPRRRRAVAV